LKHLTSANRIVPPLFGIFAIFYLAGLYGIFLRGSPFTGGGVPKNHGEFLSSMLGRNKDALASMAEKTASYSDALVIAARLAGSGIWTTSSMFGPLIHIAGFAATVPSVFLLLSQLWYGVPKHRAQVLFAMPLNIFPILFCKGTPTVQAIGLIGMMGGLLQLFSLQHQGHRSQMRI
jgi:hypothetical protein